MPMKIRHLVFFLLLSGVSGAVAQTGEAPTPPGVAYKSAIPAAQRHAYFGETHLHTAQSFDAWTFGTKVTPDQAYKFGRGETVMVPASQLSAQQGIAGDSDVPAKRAWPLDFMAVTDHSEFMGVLNQLDDPNSPVAQLPAAKKILADPASAFYFVRGNKKSTSPETAEKFRVKEGMSSAWALEIAAANNNYEPGKFTTFIAYEWTANADGKFNLHRNVFFNSDHAPMPFTSTDSNKPEDLWAYLDSVRAQGIDVIAIPHNGNVSGGLMFDWNMSNGKPIDEHYAQERALNEPLTEIVQTKGQSETVPELSPTDEFANYEIFDHLISWPSIKSNPNGSFVRQAYGRGLVIQASVGVNPFKYGVVGGSDIHNGLSVSDESGYASEISGLDPNTMLPRGDAAKRDLGIIKEPARLDWNHVLNHAPPTMERPLIFRPGGITGVWAEENTRNSIFAALKRKETFATSGTRIRVRMFGGWKYPAKLTSKSDWVTVAYDQGVPMGGDLPVRPAGRKAPRFLLQAMKDPDGANLDRIQIIKVWLEGKNYKEKVFDVVLSNGRKKNPRTGRATGVGNTVDLKTGKYTNTIGAPVLTTEWQDPQFDPAKPAVYYARVLEIPTPRWSTLLAIKNDLPIPADAPATIQERAWTSPIWYTPDTGRHND
jgi:hypothetical protein